MAERKATRLSKAARELNVGITTIVEYLGKKGHEIDSNPNTKLEPELYDLLAEAYSTDQSVKKESEKLTLKNLRDRQESLTLDDVSEKPEQVESEELLITDNTAGAKEHVKLVEEEAEAKPELTSVPEVEEKPEKPEAVAKETEPSAEEHQKVKEEELKEVAPEAKEEAKEKTPEAKEDLPETKEETTKVVEAKAEDDGGPEVVGKIDLDSMNQKTRPSKT